MKPRKQDRTAFWLKIKYQNWIWYHIFWECHFMKHCSAHPPIKWKKVGGVCNRVFRWTPPPRMICLPALGRWTPKGGRFDPTRVVFGASGDFFRRVPLPEEVSQEHFERYFKPLVNPRTPIWHRLGGFPRNRGLLQARPSA